MHRCPMVFICTCSPRQAAEPAPRSACSPSLSSRWALIFHTSCCEPGRRTWIDRCDGCTHRFLRRLCSLDLKANLLPPSDYDMSNKAQVQAENIAMSYGSNVVLRDISFV